MLQSAHLAGRVVAEPGAWIITGRAIRSQKRDRWRWASAGALGAEFPIVPWFAVVPEAPFLVVAGLLPLLLGAGMSFAFHWVVQRDQADQRQAT
jgi:hypothetical protein